MVGSGIKRVRHLKKAKDAVKLGADVAGMVTVGMPLSEVGACR